MNRGRTLSLNLPPFTGWVKRIVLACAGVFLLEVGLGLSAISAQRFLLHYFGLVPGYVLHYGMVWQLVTYSLLHDPSGIWHLIMNMFGLWMFGSLLERTWGSRRFLELYLFSTVGAGLLTVAVAYIPRIGTAPNMVTIGASGGVLGLLSAFGVAFGDMEFSLLFPPITMKAKYLAWITAFFVVVATLMPSQGGVANFAHLGGLFFGFVYARFVPTRGLAVGTSEKYFSLRNAYYRWKRRRAARKFEVYMRDHDRTVTFDEHGNYIPPDDDKKNGGGKSGWVN
jgi:membrane associated rhomboid family serine protease